MARKMTNPAVAALQSQPGGYKWCEWETDGERCRYPASICDRFCSGHYMCDDPQMGVYVVEASRDYQHLTADQRVIADKARIGAEARAYIKSVGLQKRDGEQSKDYINRLRMHARAQVGLLVKQQRAA